MALTMSFRDMLQPEAEDMFWTKSDFVLRLSTMFSEIIYHYLEKLEFSHENFKVHQWPQTRIATNLQFVGYNHKRISFREDPVEATDFNNQRQKDYKDVSNFIKMVHAFYGLPEISEENSPELLSFLECLRNSAGEEIWIKKHYCLWDFSRRFKFFSDFQTKCVQDQFEAYFNAASKKWKKVDFGKTYPPPLGFAVMFEDEPLLKEVFHYEHATPYDNTLSGLARFAGNLTARYSKDKEGNPHTKREVEWKLFNRFPFLLQAICEILMSINMYYEFACLE